MTEPRADADLDEVERRALTDLAAEFPERVAQRTTYALPFGRPVFGRSEALAVLRALRDGELATGTLIAEYERAFCRVFGFEHALAVSSGSVANTIALETLIATKRVARGDAVIVSGATFLTAVSPVTQVGCVPVFIDLAAGDVNIDLDGFARACEEHRPTAAIVPHTLGQAVDLEKLERIARAHRVSVIEDCCESLATAGKGRAVGSVGDLATFSFYAGHHMTTGEGGMVVSRDPELHAASRSMRSFGRDPAYTGKRFHYPVGDRPIGSDERYIYLSLGYNAKMTDFQAAFGLVQLKRIDGILSSRAKTTEMVVDVLRSAGLRILGDPCEDGAQPFGVAFLLPERVDQAFAATTLDEAGIEVRSFLGASLPHQPGFDGIAKRIVEPYVNAPLVATRALVVGCPPDVDIARTRAIFERALARLQA